MCLFWQQTHAEYCLSIFCLHFFSRELRVTASAATAGCVLCVSIRLDNPLGLSRHEIGAVETAHLFFAPMRRTIHAVAFAVAVLARTTVHALPASCIGDDGESDA